MWAPRRRAETRFRAARASRMGAACGKVSGALAEAPRSPQRSPPGPDALPVRSILKSSASAEALSGSGTPTAGADGVGGRRGSFVTFAGLDEEREPGDEGRGGTFGRRLFGGRAVAFADERRDGGEERARRGSFTASVPVVVREEEAHWFLSIGVDTRKAAATVMKSRLAAAKLEEERLRELVLDAERARASAEAEAARRSGVEQMDGSTSGSEEPASVRTPEVGSSNNSLVPWDVMVTVARAREGDSRAAAHKATLVVKKLAHAAAMWELKSAKRARMDIAQHLHKIEEKKGRRLASAARTKATFITATEQRERELENTQRLEDARLTADGNLAEATARVHAARTALQNARDRKKGILSTFRQAVRSSMEASVELLEFRQQEFALRATNVTKTMFAAYDEMTHRLEDALISAMDAVPRKSVKKHDKTFDIEAAAALTARDRAEASLNDATSQCMAEMRALEASTRLLLADVDEEIKNGIDEYYAAAEDERVSYLEAQRCTIACKMAHAAVQVYEDQYNATKNMSEEAEMWANALDEEIAGLNRDLQIAEQRHQEAANAASAAHDQVKTTEKEIEDEMIAIDDSNAKSVRRESVRNVFEVIKQFSKMVRDKSAKDDSDTMASLTELSIQAAGADSPRTSFESEARRNPMFGFATSISDYDATMESIMEKAQELEHSRDVQTLTRNVSRNALAYNPLQPSTAPRKSD